MESKIKAGWKTTEFWLIILGVALPAALAAGLLEGVWEKLAAVAIATLASLGYTTSRTIVKKSAKIILPFAVLGLAACGGWQQTGARTLNATKAALDVAASTSDGVYHVKCSEVAKTCEGAGAECEALKACHGKRASFNAVVKKLYRSIGLARELFLVAVDTAKEDDRTLFQRALVSIVGRLAGIQKSVGGLIK